MSAGASSHGEAVTSTGWDNQKFGLIIFIASEAIIFGALFANYFFNRAWVGWLPWPPEGSGIHSRVPAFPLAFILTVVLLVSGWTCHNAVAAIQRGRQVAMLGWLSATIVLGLLFLGGQAAEYTVLFHEGITPMAGIYGSSFFVLTGMHGAHVIAGVALLIAMYLRGLAGHFTAKRHFGLEAATLYWHFVDIVWIALYIAVYLI